MLNDILDGVTCRLDELFPECRIYTDAVKQGLEEPCFFVGLLEPTERPMLGVRAFRETGVSIQYIPEEKGEINRELSRIADILMDGMGTIHLPDGHQMNGTKKSARISDGILTFLIHYNGFVVRMKEPEETMGHITYAMEVKEFDGTETKLAERKHRSGV